MEKSLKLSHSILIATATLLLGTVIGWTIKNPKQQAEPVATASRKEAESHTKRPAPSVETNWDQKPKPTRPNLPTTGKSTRSFAEAQITLKRLTLPSEREEFLNDFIAEFGSNYPKETLEFIASLPTGALKGRMLEFQIRAMAQQNPQDTIETAQILLKGTSLQSAILHATDTWAQSNPNEAFQWALQLPNSMWKEEVLDNIITSAATKNPANAINLILDDENLSIELQDTLLNEAVREWSNKDPVSSVAWATNQDSEVAIPMLQTIYDNWSIENPLEAATSALTLPMGLRAVILPEIANAWALEAPEETLKWLATIQIPREEFATARLSAIEAWSENHASDALAYVTTLPYSDPQRNQLLLPVAMQASINEPNNYQAWYQRASHSDRELLSSISEDPR